MTDQDKIDALAQAVQDSVDAAKHATEAWAAAIEMATDAMKRFSAVAGKMAVSN